MRLPLDLAIGPPLSESRPLLAFDHGSGELVLVELQGHLELSLDGVELDGGASAPATAGKAKNGSKAGQKVGKLDLSIASRPTLLIGHHRLVGKLVTLNAPMAILKHSLPLRAPAPSSAASDMLPPMTSSPIKPTDLHHNNNNGKRVRSSSPPVIAANGETVDDRQEPANKRQAATGASSLATPIPPRHREQAYNATSPLAVSTLAGSFTPHAASNLPQTPLNVSELKRGSHEIVGIVKQKIVFSKRPEPVVNLDKESSSADEAL